MLLGRFKRNMCRCPETLVSPLLVSAQCLGHLDNMGGTSAKLKLMKVGCHFPLHGNFLDNVK